MIVIRNNTDIKEILDRKLTRLYLYDINVESMKYLSG